MRAVRDVNARRLRILGLAVALLLIGCATFPHGRVGPLPVIHDEAAVADILVGREWRSIGVRGPLVVLPDGVALYHLEEKEYAQFRVPAGRHIVGVRGISLPESSVSVDAQAGLRYGFVIWVGTLFIPGPYIRAIDDPDALSAKMTLVK